MRRLVLVGAGHSHARVLREFARRGAADVEVVLVSPDAEAPYSGMIPGWLAGHYGWQECCLDFARLCQRASATFRQDSVSALDPGRSELTLAGGDRLGYDWLSLDIGSTLNAPAGDQTIILPMRPLSELRERWENLQKQVGRLAAGARFRIVMVGGGAAGVESILAVQRHLTRLAPRVRFHFALVAATPDILPGMAAGAGRRLMRRFAERGIVTTSNFSAEKIVDDRLIGSDGRTLQADAVLWATGAEAYLWPRKAGLSTDQRGFVRVDSTLRSLSHRNIFAAGDCAGWEPPLSKAGVYAVRMGPVLARNLHAALTGQPLRQYVPQRRNLVLIGSGNDEAVAAWGAFSSEGAWVWRWKQFIDRRFVAHYNDA